MLNKRQNRVVDLLREQDCWMTGKEIAAYLQVTDRTIRSDIDTINEHYGCALIESNIRHGYRLDKNISLEAHVKMSDDYIPQTGEERRKWLLQELLFKSKKLDLDEVKGQIYVSDTSLENDIKKIRKELKKYSTLKLTKRKNQLSLDGDEIEKRSLYKNLLTQETHGNFINMNTIAAMWTDFDLLELCDVIKAVMKKYNYDIRESVFPMTMIHVGVAIERIINHNYISKLNVDPSLQESVEYHISKDFFQEISERLSIEVVDIEIDIFALLLLGKGSCQYYDFDKKYVEELIDEIFTEIKSFFGIDFSKDYDLRVGLTSHLCSLINRQKNNMKVTNLYLKQIKKNYPLVFEMAVHSGEVIRQYTHCDVNENEMAFLSLHLGAAYDRLSLNHQCRAVTIIPHGQMLSKSCIDKLNTRFSTRMDIVTNLIFFEEKEIEKLHPDLILTTVPLIHNLDIPTVNISLFVSYEDESRIFQTLNSLEKQYYEEDFQTLLKKLMKKDLFKIVENGQSGEEIIKDMCDDLIALDLADSEYKKDVLKRESISATSFVYGIAIPHSVSALTKESCIVTRILKNPVKWGDFDVRLVMLLGIHEVDSSLLKILFDSISEMVVNTDKFTRLLDVTSYEEYVNVILEQGEQENV